MSFHGYTSIGPYIKITSDKRFSIYDFYEKYDLELDTFALLTYENINGLSKNSYILIENKHREGTAPKKLRLDADSGDFKEILPEQPDAELNWFKKHYADDIESLKLELGEANVSISFGIVLYLA